MTTMPESEGISMADESPECSRCGRLLNPDGTCWACDEYVEVRLTRGEANALLALARGKGREGLNEEARRGMDALYAVSLNAEVAAVEGNLSTSQGKAGAS